MNRLIRTIETIYNNPYLLYGSGNIHEQCFEKILNQHGINKILPCYKEGYIRHPYGTNRFPDFHIHLKNHIIPIELKSTNRNRCNIGDTWIKQNCIYIISYPSNTYISLGQNMINEKEEEMYQNYYTDINIIRKKYKNSYKKHIILYPRSTIQYNMLESEKEINYQKVLTHLCNKN